MSVRAWSVVVAALAVVDVVLGIVLIAFQPTDDWWGWALKATTALTTSLCVAVLVQVIQRWPKTKGDGTR